MKSSASPGPRIGDEAVSTRTSKTWAQWFELLDRAGAKKMGHREIVAVIAGRHPEIGGWWAQMVTVAYEQARGKREKHEKPEGFQIGAARTAAVPVTALYRAWTEERTRRRWLSGARFSVRKATGNRSLRMAWSDGSRVDVNFYAKGPGKSQVAVQHGKLPNAASAGRMKKLWKERLESLKALLEE